MPNRRDSCPGETKLWSDRVRCLTPSRRKRHSSLSLSLSKTLRSPRAGGQSRAPSPWGGHPGAGTQPRRCWPQSPAPAFCASVARRGRPALFSSTAVEICHQHLRRVTAPSSSPPCPPPPYRCPLCLPPARSHSARRSEFSISTFLLFFFFSSPPSLFCFLLTAFGISRTARTP